MTQDNILVVEDEIEIAKAIAIYLKSQNYNVYIAHNGKEGIEIIENNTIHLAIVDIMMPIMDGIEMTMKVPVYLDDTGEPYQISLTTDALLTFFDQLLGEQAIAEVAMAQGQNIHFVITNP